MLKKILLPFWSLLAAILMAEPVTFTASLAPEGAIHSVGTVARFSGKVTAGDGVPANARVFYEEFVNGIVQRSGFVKLGETLELERKLDEPGWYDVRMLIVDENGKEINVENIRWRSMGKGMLIAPEKIARSDSRPADFDEFWNSRRALLDKVPIKELSRRQINNGSNSPLAVYDVKVACAGSQPMTGVLTIPRGAQPRSLPAVVFYQGAGVSTAVSVGSYGKRAITLMVQAHGLENLRERSFYTDLYKTSLKGYQFFNKNDREKIYFHDMFLRVMRSLDYVKSLPEWDGKVLIVRGGSQGGAQSIVAAAMDPQVTLLAAEVPAMCDHAGFLMKRPRLCGWPCFYRENVPQDVVEAAAYYDMVNFAARIKCETFITAGALDHVCSPCGVAAAFNAVSAENKRFLVHSGGEHIIPQIDAEFRRPFIDRIEEYLNKK